MYVIKFDNNLYWCGYNTADKQLRKAIIYKSIKQAVAAAEDCLIRRVNIHPQNLMSIVKTYKIIKIEIKEIDEIKDAEVLLNV